MAEFCRFWAVFAGRLLLGDGLWRPIGPRLPKRLCSAFRDTKPWVEKAAFSVQGVLQFTAMSAFGGKADVIYHLPECPLIAVVSTDRRNTLS